MTVSFFPVVIKISRHNKKTANFPPEPKTDTTAQPARQTTVSFFSGHYNDRDRKKKVPVVIKFVLVQLELKPIQIR